MGLVRELNRELRTVINLLKSGLLTDIQIREITGLDQEQLDELKKR